MTSVWSGKYQLGLKPVQPGAVKLALADYLTPDILPTPPDTFGHDRLVPSWGMLLNDRLGDCAIAGALHETMLWNRERGVTVPIDSDCVVDNYSAITGYEPGPELTDPYADPNPTDQGTDIGELFEYRRRTGLVDADGKRHKVVAYAGLTPGDFNQLVLALYLFTAVGVGIHVPDYAEKQFEAGGPWDREPGHHTIVGGHYIPAVARDHDVIDIVTWGGQIGMTADFYHSFSTTAVVGFSREMITAGRSLDGFDDKQLLRDLKRFNTGPVMAPHAAP